MDFLHQFTLPCVLWFFSFIKPSLGHLPLARTFFFALLQDIFIYPVKRENFPFTVQYNDTNIRSKSLWLSHFCFLLLHFFGLRNLYRACMLNLGYHWTGYLFYRLKKSSRHKVRTWRFTHAYRLPPIESPLSALASTFGGIVRPICFAAFRLMTNSNFFGCSIGKRGRSSSASSPAPPRRSESPGSLEFDTPRTADRRPRRPSTSALAPPCR